MDDQQYRLQWNNHQQNLITIFKSLLDFEELVDVTISVEGKHIKAHKVVLSACSPYFKLLFSVTPSKHPIVILNDIKYKDMKIIIDYIYCGQVSVSDEQLANILEIAETLQVRGLFDPKQSKSSPENKSSNHIENARKRTKKKNSNDVPAEDMTVGQYELHTGIVDPALWPEQQFFGNESVTNHCESSLLQDFESNLEGHYGTNPTTLSTPDPSPYIPTTVPNAMPGRRRHFKVQESENFLLALEAVRSGKLGFCKAAKLYGLNNRTLWLEYKKRGYPRLRPPVRKPTDKQNT